MTNYTPTITTLDSMFDQLRANLRAPTHQKWRPVYVSTKIRAAAFLTNSTSFVHDGEHIDIGFRDLKGGVWEVNIVGRL